MVRLLAPVFLVPILAEDSLMQAHELDAAHSAGASRTLRMQQNSQEMEEQYKAILSNIIKTGSWDDPQTGNPWVPGKGLLDPVMTVLKSMEGELDDQKKLNTNIMGEHTDAVAKCNTQRDASLSGDVSSKKNTMTSDRSTHGACRKDEDGDISDMEAKCKSFNDLSKCGHEQDWYAAIDEKKSGKGSLQEAVDQAVSCKTAIGKTSDTAQRCDDAQDTFKDAFCDYASALSTTCSDHEDCWSNAAAGWDQAKQTITKLEGEQKTIYRMLGRIRCYLNLLFGASDGSKPPAQADMDKCMAVSSIEDSSLNVDYKTTLDTINGEKGKCLDSEWTKDESIENRPGGGKWYSAEFGGMTAHSKLQEDSAC